MYKDRVENDRKKDTSSFYLGNSAKQSEEIQNHRKFLFSSAGFPWSQDNRARISIQIYRHFFTLLFYIYPDYFQFPFLESTQP